MEKPKLTKEYLQQKIDHYTAVSTAHNELTKELPEKRENHIAMMMFYSGKSDAYTDLYNALYPEMEAARAYPLDKQAQSSVINSTKRMYVASTHAAHTPTEQAGPAQEPTTPPCNTCPNEPICGLIPGTGEAFCKARLSQSEVKN